jgi:hypothetical protein
MSATQKVDVLVVGAGPAALSALIGMASASSMSVLQLSGADLPAMGPDSWLMGGLSRPQVAAQLGLPAVRAFGPGGTTQLWHGGLFIPHAGDAIVSHADRLGTGHDLLAPLRKVAAGGSGQPGQLFPSLRRVIGHCERSPAERNSPRREVFVPRMRSKITEASLREAGKAFRAWQLDAASVVDVALANGKLQVLCASAQGYRVVEAGHLVMAAGVLGSALLMRRLLGLGECRFGDHYHVFSGVVPSKAVAALTATTGAGDGGLHRGLKFAVELEGGERADVMFTFRRVSNPDFPRSGRRFGKFVGINALSRLDKLALIAKNPMTGVEMLAYLWGVQLPLTHSLVHSTVSLHARDGRITDSGIDPNIPRAKITAAVAKAWEQMAAVIGNAAGEPRLFDAGQIKDSVISGAQFVGSLSELAPSGSALMERITLADCSRFAFTSVYNQGLVSLAAGYLATAGKFD